MAEQNNDLGTPTTPRGEGHGSESRLESLPRELLVKILRRLSHNHLTNVSQVSRTLRKAVQNVNHKTPDCSRVKLQRAGRWSDPLPRANTRRPTRRGDFTRDSTTRRLDFS